MYFLDTRCMLIEIAALLDRYDRAAQDASGKMPAGVDRLDRIYQALTLLAERETTANRSERLLNLFSDLTLIESGIHRRSFVGVSSMQIIQPHYHGIARTAQDYERMAMSGVVAVAEPAFWAGFDRAYPETFLDYFRQISEFEPTRAAQYGIRHFCWVAVNPKEAENPPLSREVMRHHARLLSQTHRTGCRRNRIPQDHPERRSDL